MMEEGEGKRIENVYSLVPFHVFILFLFSFDSNVTNRLLIYHIIMRTSD